jgi:hypothetical protein
VSITFDYPERFSPNGRRIVDEKCACGHRRTQHEHRFDLGHGVCTQCVCGQFTWVEFIFEQEKEGGKQ